jgi:hypothetical protein
MTLHRHLYLTAFLGLMGAAACSGPDVNLGDRDGGTSVVNDAGTQPDSAMLAADSGPPPSGSQPISLETALDASKKYRLAIVWYQFNDDGPDPATEVVHDVAFDPRQTSMTMPTVPAPGSQNIVCTRDGVDEAIYPCRADSPYNLGLALIAIVEDRNGNGKTELPYAKSTDPTADAVALWGWAHLVHSAKGGDVIPSKNPGDPPALIDGTTMPGTFLYEAYATGVLFDRLRPFTAGKTLEFKVKGPNLT